MYKKLCCTCKVVVLLIKAISKVFFFDFLLAVAVKAKTVRSNSVSRMVVWRPVQMGGFK